MSSGSQTIDRKKINKVKGQAKPRRFTIHTRSRKKSQQVTLPTIGGAAEDELHDSRGTYPESTRRSSLATSLNWSVPNDLPTVTQQVSSDIQSGPTSLENLSITLEPDSNNLDRDRCASNPDIVSERQISRKPRPRLPADFYSVSDIQRGPGSAGPLTCDVSVQVDSKHIFTFPTPPNSVSPTLPIELSHLSSPPHHHALLFSQKYVNISKQQDHNGQEDQHTGQFSSSNSLDNRHSGGSFPFVPEEDEDDVNEDKTDYSNSRKNGRVTNLLSTTDTIEEEEVKK